MTLAAGSRLGPYEVLAPLGAGGMGEVYRARDSRLGRDVAIKVLPSELSSDPERLKRFEKEAQSASSLNHPSIVTIYEIGQADAVSWIAMELVEGKTLRELVAAGPLPIRKLLQIGAQVADGLARAHGAGIVHRDLKPENVMVTKDGLAKILDFGLAKLSHAGTGSGDETNLPTQTATAPGVVLGTVGYMSPEQASARAVDFRSDQFSFGSLLYEMASGKRAFQRSTAVLTLAAIIQDDPEPIGAVNPQVPTPLRWILERCLAKDPEDRYASTTDLSRELATVRDRLSEASFSGAAPAAAPSRRSSRLLAAAAALALLVGLFAGIFAGRPIWKASFATQPTLRQITFRRATILDAWFAPDGQVVYAASAEDPTKEPGEIFSTRPGAFEARSLGLPPANILAVSNTGELAILVGGHSRQGTLATVPLAGGAPRELLEDVRRASWAPDGKSLAVLHIVKGKQRIEYPIGKVLYESAGWIGKIQVSPKGDLIAFTDRAGFVPGAPEAGELMVVDLAGKSRKLGRFGNELTWSPRGDEIWVNRYSGKTSTIQAVSLSGRSRRVASFPGDFAFHDLSREGRVLLEGIVNQSEIVGRFSGEPVERNLSWLDGSTPADLSADGKTILFTELGQGGGPNHAVYKRRTDGSPAVRLGEGIALALSPDGSWALSTTPDATKLVLIPTGAGQERIVSLRGIRIFGREASFFPDGKRVLLRAAEAGTENRLFVIDLDSGQARAITPEKADVSASFAISPDGRTVVSSSEEEGSSLYDVDGGPSRRVPGLPAGLYAIKWCADGRSLFVRTTGIKPLRVYRLELTSGRLELWREFSVTDIRTGEVGVIPTPDGKSYVYGYTRDFSDLFIAEGLQ